MGARIRLIVGLGNPGREYSGTRHNAGAWFVTRLAERLRAPFSREAKFHADVAKFATKDGDLRLAMPRTYMNESGLAVASVARFFRMAPEEIVVAHDELDLKPGTVKIKHGGGSAGHNGLKDIVGQLGSGDFWRLRIGIGHPRDTVMHERAVVDYVLHPPAPDELRLIDDAIDRALTVWPQLADGDAERAMHMLHTRAASAVTLPLKDSAT